MDKCHSPILKDFLVSLLNLKRSTPSELSYIEKNSSLVNIWKLRGGNQSKVFGVKGGLKGWIQRIHLMNSKSRKKYFSQPSDFFVSPNTSVFPCVFLFQGPFRSLGSLKRLAYLQWHSFGSLSREKNSPSSPDLSSPGIRCLPHSTGRQSEA